MKIRIVATGRLKERFWKDACAEYLKRLKAYAQVSLVEVADRDPARCGGVRDALAQEGADILRALPLRAHVILLDSRGRERTSEQIAARLDELALGGVGELTFIIGGSHGVDAQVYEAANESLSLGRITLPHNLARVVLLEQVYRAFKINRGEPYHK